MPSKKGKSILPVSPPLKPQRIINKLKSVKLRWIIVALLAPLLIFLGVLVYLFKDVPNPQKLTKSPAPVSTQILDRNGALLYEVYSDQNRTPIPLDDIPSYVRQATISIEDKNFYHHSGLDTRGILRATFKTLTGQRLEGGSTITQQLVKNALLSDTSRTISRKIREAGLAITTEIIYSKDQILELYLNHAPYGGTVYGIQAAAKTYFDKDAKDLNLAESTLLAGLPQSPTKYSPFGAHPELAIARQHSVLRRMVEDGYISEDQAKEAQSTPLKFADRASNIQAPHFALLIRDLLVDKYGEETVNLGGLRVTTTLDLSLQNYAEASVAAEVNKLKNYRVSNGAALVTRPNTGEVLAMVGSKNYFDRENDGNVNLTVRLRQPGSSIKPLNYALGLLNGWTASTMYLDIPTCFTVTGQKPYCPQNYDGSFRGPVQMRFALGNSYNIPAVKQLALNGIEPFIATASAMGISSWKDPSRFGLSLTLGGGEVTMWDLSTAYGTFANAGVTVPLNPILKVETYDGKILEERKLTDIADTVSSMHEDWTTFWNNQSVNGNYQQSDIRVSLPEEVAFIISHILLDNNARTAAFGSRSELVIPGKNVSVKTGTTNDLRDNWTVGYTPDYLVATWVGNNDNTPMSRVASGVTGASPIWNDIMRHLLADKPDHFPDQPQGIEFRNICTLTGLQPTSANNCDTRSEIFIKQSLPPTQTASRKQIWVRRSDKYPLLPGDTTIDLDLEEHTVISDPFTKDFCLDCNYAVGEEGKWIWPQTTVNYSTFVAPSPQTHTISDTDLESFVPVSP